MHFKHMPSLWTPGLKILQRANEQQFNNNEKIYGGNKHYLNMIFFIIMHDRFLGCDWNIERLS